MNLEWEMFNLPWCTWRTWMIFSVKFEHDKYLIVWGNYQIEITIYWIASESKKQSVY